MQLERRCIKKPKRLRSDIFYHERFVLYLLQELLLILNAPVIKNVNRSPLMFMAVWLTEGSGVDSVITTKVCSYLRNLFCIRDGLIFTVSA